LDKAVISYYSSKYKPVPLPERPNYSHKDVSIIVPTIDTEATFTECMRLWLKANPREIVIATVERNKARVEQLIEPLRQHADKIIIVTAALANKRHQLIVGVKAARGKSSLWWMTMFTGTSKPLSPTPWLHLRMLRSVRWPVYKGQIAPPNSMSTLGTTYD
jgi:SepF-like predicted cell division protein (DUF552 family)